jgi:two-component system response regulator YesN
MWKLMIADDEPRIRRGLRNVLPWSDLGIEIVGEAEDGLVALELAKQLQPNILFVDICMPFMDGLELIEQLKMEIQHCIIIVISGHDEFNYAQKAIKLNVFDYLLKPVMKHKLEEVVQGALKALNEDLRSEEHSSWMDVQIKGNSMILRDTFLLKWLDGRLSEEEVARNLNYFQLDFGERIGMIVFKVVQSLDTGKASRIWDRDLLGFALQNIAEDILKNEPVNAVFKDKKGHIVIIGVVEKEEKWQKLSEKIMYKIESLLEKIVILESRLMTEHLMEAADIYTSMVEEVNRRGSLSPIIILTKKMIDRNFHNPGLTLQEVADNVHVSPTYLSKQLKKELGTSFIDYLTEVRIRNAIQIMNDPSAKVYEIAERVGYSSQHYFSNAFKKVTGMPPLMYKKGIR